MRIVVLDAYTLNPGDNPWDQVAALGELVLYDRSAPEEVLARAAGAEVILLNKTPLRAETLEKLPDLRHISVLATGYDIVDAAAAGRLGISVSNAPAYGVEAVAQQAMSLLLELCRGVGRHDLSVKNGDWARCPDWCYWLTPQRELAGLVMGLIGFGHNGRRVGELAHAFGMEVLAYTVPAGEPPAYGPFRFVELDELFRVADVISLHCPLTEATRHIVNRESLSGMKPNAFIINTARGPLVDEEAVAEALVNGRLGGYGTDVLSVEPPAADNPLLTAPNTLITPHISWATLGARRNIMGIVAGNIRAYLAGSPVNLVNGQYLSR